MVVDDASATREAEVITQGFGFEYRRLKRNHGLPRARMAALADVDTEYVAFVDDDDVVLTTWLELHLAKAHLGYDVIAASYWETDENLERRPYTRLVPATFADLLAGHCPVNDGAWIRTEALQGITWRPERKKAVMFSLWLALAAKGATFTAIGEPCWLYRRHGASLSASFDEQDARYRQEAIAEWTP